MSAKFYEAQLMGAVLCFIVGFVGLVVPPDLQPVGKFMTIVFVPMGAIFFGEILSDLVTLKKDRTRLFSDLVGGAFMLGGGILCALWPAPLPTPSPDSQVMLWIGVFVGFVMGPTYMIQYVIGRSLSEVRS